MFGFILRIIDRLLSEFQLPNPELTSPAWSLTDEPGQDILTISIYQTDRLTQMNGRVPERTLVRHIFQAMNVALYDVKIVFDHDPIPGDYRPPDGENLARWSSACPDSYEKNILLHSGRGGGIAYVGGRYALAPGGLIDRELEVYYSTDDPDFRNVRAGLHELGHLLGGLHSDEMIPAPYLVYQNTESGWMDSPPPP